MLRYEVRYKGTIVTPAMVIDIIDCDRGHAQFLLSPNGELRLRVHHCGYKFFTLDPQVFTAHPLKD